MMRICKYRILEKLPFSAQVDRVRVITVLEQAWMLVLLLELRTVNAQMGFTSVYDCKLL